MKCFIESTTGEREPYFVGGGPTQWREPRKVIFDPLLIAYVQEAFGYNLQESKPTNVLDITFSTGCKLRVNMTYADLLVHLMRVDQERKLGE